MEYVSEQHNDNNASGCQCEEVKYRIKFGGKVRHWKWCNFLPAHDFHNVLS